MIKKIKIKLPVYSDLNKRIKQGQYLGVGGILKWENNFILVANLKHPSKKWSFITVGVKPNEKPKEAIIREIKEETNLKAKIEKEICLLEASNLAGKKVNIYIYQCRGTGIPKPGKDIKALGIFKELPSNLHPLCQKILKIGDNLN